MSTDSYALLGDLTTAFLGLLGISLALGVAMAFAKWFCGGVDGGRVDGILSRIVKLGAVTSIVGVVATGGPKFISSLMQNQGSQEIVGSAGSSLTPEALSGERRFSTLGDLMETLVPGQEQDVQEHASEQMAEAIQSSQEKIASDDPEEQKEGWLEWWKNTMVLSGQGYGVYYDPAEEEAARQDLEAKKAAEEAEKKEKWDAGVAKLQEWWEQGSQK